MIAHEVEPLAAAGQRLGPRRAGPATFPEAVRRAGIPDLDELFEEARELGGDRVRVYGCTTSVKLLHLDAAKLQMCDAMMGHASFLKIAEGGQLITT